MISTEPRTDTNGVSYTVANLSDGTYVMYGDFALPADISSRTTINSSGDLPKTTTSGDVSAPADAPVGQQCDKYPFASTKEGSRTGNYSIRMVTGSHNSAAGGLLIDFYNLGRVGQNGEFFVQIVS